MVLVGIGGGKTVTELRAAMTATERAAWWRFYCMFPFDDLHRYHRPAAVIAALASGAKDAQKVFDSAIDMLAPEPIPPGMTQADWTTMKAFRQIGAPPRRKESHGDGI